jgi:outer membrane biosynthesis protein TonB
MTPKRTLQLLIVLAGLCPIPLSFAETHGALELTQESDPSTQTQTASSRANDVVKSAPDVSPPALVSGAEPKFSKAARKNRLHGNVLVNLYIEANGTPSNIHATRADLFDSVGNKVPDPESTPAGHDLIKAAVDAVSKYKFKPAMKNGNPVKTALNVEVHFQSQ